MKKYIEPEMKYKIKSKFIMVNNPETKTFKTIQKENREKEVLLRLMCCGQDTGLGDVVAGLIKVPNTWVSSRVTSNEGLLDGHGVW